MRQRAYVHRGGQTPLLGVPIHAHLRRGVEQAPEHEALVSVHQARRLTYGALWHETGRLARGLLALGIQRGDRVGIWATDHLEWVLLQLATARVGAVLVNINPANRSAELQHALQAAQVQALFLMPAFRRSHYVEMVLDLLPECHGAEPGALRSPSAPTLTRLVLFDPARPGAPARPAPAFDTWPEVLAAGDDVSPRALEEREDALEADDPINIQFTSGTTGFPKPVVLTHHNILNNAYFAGEAMCFGPADRLCVPVPFYHCFGMVVSNLLCFSRRATLVIPAQHFDAGATLHAIDAERCTAVHGVPTMFVAELECPDFARYDLTSLRTGIMAGAPCPPELVRRVREDMGCRDILIGYGQTEASPVTHLTRPGDAVERAVETVGTNLPHQEVKIVDPATGALVDEGEQGEVCFRGYHVMRGYFERPQATAETIDEAGWLHSGDLGVLDPDGYLRITGRLKDMIIRGGENVYPAEIEAYYFTHPKVAQVAVFGVPDARLGEEVAAWVELHEGEQAQEEELREFARVGLAHFKVPRHVRIVTEFPMTVTGKIQKFRMRELMEQELAEAEDSPTASR